MENFISLISLLGARLETLYAPIRQKLAAALVNWHPSDCSAKLILEPWKPVFSQGIMDAFVITNIVPKLGVALQAYVINPHQQHLGIFFSAHFYLLKEKIHLCSCLL